MKVRICSCPKRDKEKEEEDLKSKHVNTIPQGKRAATPETEDHPLKMRKVDDFIQVKDIVYLKNENSTVSDFVSGIPKSGRT
jgi:hypothetical protein